MAYSRISTTSAATATLCLRKRRRNSCHCERATGSRWAGGGGPPSPSSTGGRPGTARTASSAPLMSSLVLMAASRQSDSWIEDAVQDVGQQVEQDDEHRR